ncbi:MAG: sulfatase/phosphatase domain-containing protein [Verrucomicrobiota bacterium]
MTSLLARERRLAAEVDAIVERAIRFHWPPAEIFATVWPPVLQAVGGLCAAASLIDEFGALQRFTSRDETCWPPECAALFEVREATHRVLSDRSFLAYPMDVAGERLGALVVELPRRLDEAEGAARAQLLAAAVEVLDNHLGSLVSARRKQEVAQGHVAAEGGIRSPLVVWGPGFVPAARAGSVNRESAFATIDLVPTILDLAGVAAPRDVAFDGVALREVLLGNSNASRGRPLFFRRPPDRGSFSGIENLPDLAVRDGRWKLLCEYDGTRAELYDLVADPAESKDVAAAHPAETQRLTEAVVAWHRSLPADHGTTYVAPVGKKKKQK